MGTRKKPPRYVDYDYEAAYQEQLDRDDKALTDDLKRRGARCIYATKRVDAGDQVDLEIYPEFSKRDDVPEAGRRKGYNAAAQRNLKDKNARKQCERLINENFTSRDLWATFTYTQDTLPQSMDEALENMQKYIKRLNYRRQKKALPPARYVYVTEWSEEEGKKIRCHHHIVMDGDMSMDDVESLWKLGRRNEIRRLDYDENGLTGLARYITKDPKGRRRWCASKNLRKPAEHKNHSQFSQRKVEKMAENYDDAVEMIKKAAPGCIFKTLERRYNEWNGKFYIYARLRRLCNPGDLVTIQGGESLGLDNAAAYVITETDGPMAWIRKNDKPKSKRYQVPLEKLHLLQRKDRSGRTARRNP